MLHLDIAQQDHQKAGKSALHSQTWQVGLCLHGQQAQQLLLRIHVTLQCHAVLHSGTIEGWSGVNCFKTHTKLEPTLRLELSEKLSMDWRRSKKSSSH